MKRKFSKHYQTALLSYLRQAPDSPRRSARGMGEKALAAGMRTLDMAKLHEQILVTQALPGRANRMRATLIKRAGAFFGEAIMPIDGAAQKARSGSDLHLIVAILSRRTVELAASNMELELEIDQHKATAERLKKSERHYCRLLEQSDRLQQHLRRLSQQALLAQEDERKRISRELHDVIAQTLTGINFRLATLKREAALNVAGLDRNIARTQRLVQKSVNIVHRFARELRPAVLDDLGLVPALLSLLKNFTARTGVRTHMTAFKGVERLDMVRRTALFRVAQEALTNVTRHAQASRVDVTIWKEPNRVFMTVKDDGKSFDVAQAQRGRKRLGLLGMRERIEMVGGAVKIESAPGHGASVTVEVPSTPSLIVAAK